MSVAVAVARREGRLAVEEAVLPEAHGARGLRLPRLRVRTGELLGTLPARGDVLRETLHLHAAEPEGARWVPFEPLVGAWRAGARVFTPALSAVLRATASGRDLGAFGSWEVAPGVRLRPYGTPTLPPATHTNTFLLGPEGGELLLVEPAPPGAEALEDLVRWAGAHGRVVALALTHHHPDHVGAAEALRARLGVPLLAHEATAERLRGQVTVDRCLEDGEVLRLAGRDPARDRQVQEIEAIFTPGHAPGHLCFRDVDSGVALVGDMVAGVGTILVEPRDGDMTAYLASLARLHRRGLTRLLPAHGGVLADPRAVLQRFRDHRLAREAKVRSALAEASAAGATPSRADALVPSAYAEAPRAVWPLAALAVEAHLVKLERDGFARRETGGWTLA